MTVDLAKKLIACPSVTPNESGCHGILSEILTGAGFAVEEISEGGVSNLWATHGSGGPLICFAGHIDVVPPGPIEAWQSDPFQPEIRNGMIYGRGAADMKGSMAAMVSALVSAVADDPDHAGTYALLSTSDEEGPAVFGTRLVLDTLASRGVKIDFAVVGEPTSDKQFGDTIKVGRRGSLSGKMVVRGIQGHVAYPHLARNPIHEIGPFLVELTSSRFDDGDEYFAPTSLQISNIHAGTGAGNVIPGSVTVNFNLRYAAVSSPENLIKRIEAIAERSGFEYEIAWDSSAKAFRTESPVLASALSSAVLTETGVQPELGTGGGTSDARFFAEHGIPVAEFGPLNATIHAANECISTADLEASARVFGSVLNQLANV